MSKQFEIGEMNPVDIDLLRTQRDSLLEVIEVLSHSKPDFIEDIFAFDKVATIENLDGLVHLCDAILDEAELR